MYMDLFGTLESSSHLVLNGPVAPNGGHILRHCEIACEEAVVNGCRSFGFERWKIPRLGWLKRKAVSG